MPSLQQLEPEPTRVMSSASTHMRRAGLLVSERRLAEAEVEIARALTEAPDDLRANKLLALVRFRLGRLVDAREAYRRVIAVAPDDAAARLNLGLIALKLERFDEAATELSAAVELRPDDARALGYLGHAYARLGRTAEAVRVFRQAGQPEIAAEIESRAAATSQPAVLSRDDFASPFDAREQPDREANDGGQPLTGFLHGRLLDSSPATSTKTSTKTSPSSEGVYRLVLGDDSRTSSQLPGGAQVYVQAGALLAAVGTVAVEPARRRQRGQEAPAPLASEGVVFLACRGRGELWLTPVSPALRLDALTLEEDALFVRESSVLAFSGDLVWESGAIPRSGVRMLHLHGNGRVVVDWLGRDVVAIRLAEGQPLTVPLRRLCGWLGQLVLRLQPAARPGGATLVACEGEGVLLLARNGQASERVHERAEPGHDGAGPPDPGRPALHR